MSKRHRVLIVDDEEGIRFSLKRLLSRDRFEAEAAASGEEALALLRDTAFDLVILDLRLGGRTDGMRVLEAVKWRWPETAVIILTAYGSLESAMEAIREGVDGYLLKPCEMDELQQAVHEALARRRHLPQPQKGSEPARFLQWGALSLDRDERLVTLDKQPLELTPREFNLLTCLMQEAPRPVSPQELVQATLGYRCQDAMEARDVIKWYIYRLRRKVEADPARPRYILNVRGVGYKLGNG